MSADRPTPAHVIDLLERNSGPHPGYRRAQARGACFQGIFTPSGEASGLTTAAHLQRAAVPATVRFSHSDGNPGMPDTERVVRGLTTRFHLRGDDYTDLLAVSIPVFLAANPDDFVEAVEALQPDPATGVPDLARIGKYVAAHPQTAGAFAGAQVPPPVSYATVRYWALHAFIWRDRQGQRQAVRYRWEPDAGVASLSDEDLEIQPPDYLTQEMTDRLLHEPASFTLRVQLAEPGDPTDDPTIPWPDDRPEIVAGHLQLTAPVDNQAYWDAQAFSPTALTDGMEASDDPILAFRAGAYAESYRRRTAEGTPPAS